MGKQRPLEYPHFETVERSDSVGTWRMHTTALDQATAMGLIPSRYNHDARIVVMHRDHSVRVPFHPNAQRCNFMAPPSRKPKGRGECMAFIYAHPVYQGDDPGFAQHVRWRALDSMFDVFSVLNGYDSHEKVELLKERTMEYVDNCTNGGTLLEYESRESQFTAEHPGWCISWAGRSGGYMVLQTSNKNPALMHESYRQLWSGDLDGWDVPTLTMVAHTLYDFDCVCGDMVYDVLTEGHVSAFGDSFVVPLRFT